VVTDAHGTEPSLWEATAPAAAFPALEGRVEVDAAVVGAGIVGVTAAYLVKRAGRRVALLEAGRVGQGTTGRTTAKLTVGHGLVYRDLAAEHGKEAARLYAESNQAALAELEHVVRRHGIDCDWESAANYVYTTSPERVGDLEAEAEAARLAGVEAELTTTTGLPFPVEAALRVDGQAQLHPLKLLLGLAGLVPGDGSHVFEHTRSTGLRRGERHVIQTSAGEVLARHVVVATHLPFLGRGLLFAKAHPVKSYAIAATVEEERAPKDMFISVDAPTRSLRSAPAGRGSRTVIVGGESGVPGEDAGPRYGALADFMREHFGVPPERRWSAHDFVPLDGLPYIGRPSRRDERVYVATGFAKWGLTKGVLAAGLVTGSILGTPSGSAAELFDARRRPEARDVARLARENAKVAGRFLGDRLVRPVGRARAERLPAGEGAVVRIGAGQYAVHRDESGRLHVLSARCPHLGCIVRWSGSDRTWECPCHGSRFAADGTLVEGPATHDLEARTLPGGD
jgi:glycine/D-amino acid oxidase-like deaminating enzyme/nitrite reductase/ring-hydroxylating ferredoxin subunit